MYAPYQIIFFLSILNFFSSGANKILSKNWIENRENRVFQSRNGFLVASELSF